MSFPAPVPKTPEALEAGRLWMNSYDLSNKNRVRLPFAGTWNAAGGYYEIKWHGANLGKIVAENGDLFRSQNEAKAFFEPVLEKMIKDMKYWKKGPAVGGLLGTLARKGTSPVAMGHTAMGHMHKPKKGAEPEITAEEEEAMRRGAEMAAERLKKEEARYGANEVVGGKEMEKLLLAALNTISHDNFEKTVARITRLVPESDADFRDMIAYIFNHALNAKLNTDVYMQVVIAMEEKHKSRAYPASPVSAFIDLVVRRYEMEPVSVRLEDGSLSENAAVAAGASVDEIAMKRQFQITMFMVGLLYRLQMIPYGKFKAVVEEHLKKIAATTAEDEFMENDVRYRQRYVEALCYVMMRAAKRLMQDGAVDFLGKVNGLIAKYADGGAGYETNAYTRGICAKYLDAVKMDYKFKSENIVWGYGAPKENLIRSATRKSASPKRNQTRKSASPKRASPKRNQTRKSVSPKRSPTKKNSPKKNQTRKSPKINVAEYNSPKVHDIIKRFPVTYDLKDGGKDGVIVKAFNQKQATERYEKAPKKLYASVEDFKAKQIKMLETIFAESKYWKKGPAMPGMLMNVVAR
jgi:hypothetical protein